MGMTPIIAPDGSSGDIPVERIQEALKAGGKPAVWMKGPDGSIGVIPRERALEAMKAGGRAFGSLEALRQADVSAGGPPPSPYYGLTPSNLLKNVWEGTKELAVGTYELGKDLVSNPDWITGKNSTLEKFVVNPANVEVEKAGQEFAKGRTLPGLGHVLASAVPFVGPFAAAIGERAGTGDIGGALGSAAPLAVAVAATKYVPKALERYSGPAAERVAQSILGPEPKNIPSVSRPAPALAAEAPVALTERGLLKQINERISEHNETVKTAAAADLKPAESLWQLLNRATEPEILRAEKLGMSSVAERIRGWRENYLENNPKRVDSKQLYEMRQDLGKGLSIFRGAKATAEDIGLDQAQREVYREMNRTLDQRIPGIRAVTERESGLIMGRDMLANRLRKEAGGPLLPSPRIYLGEGTGGEIWGGIRITPTLPLETLAKTLLIRGLKTPKPLPKPIPTPPPRR